MRTLLLAITAATSFAMGAPDAHDSKAGSQAITLLGSISTTESTPDPGAVPALARSHATAGSLVANPWDDLVPPPLLNIPVAGCVTREACQNWVR